MKDCRNCKSHTWGNEWWNCPPECIRCRYTDGEGGKVPSNWKPMPMSNADRFRDMSDEEQQKCVRRFWEVEDFADWLKQPVKENE